MSKSDLQPLTEDEARELAGRTAPGRKATATLVYREQGNGYRDRVLELWTRLHELDCAYGVALGKWKKEPTEENRLAAKVWKDRYRECNEEYQLERKRG